MTGFVFAHGAGGHCDDPGMLRLSGLLAGLGIDVVRFNFDYREKGQPQKLRDAHLPKIRVPVLCFNGTFHVLKSSGRSDADVLAEVGAATAKWVRSYPF